VSGLQSATVKPAADGLRLNAALVTQVALGGAIAQSEAWGIESAWGQGMTESRHHAALAQERGCRLIRRSTQRQTRRPKENRSTIHGSRQAIWLI
jgi:hypothetical protein